MGPRDLTEADLHDLDSSQLVDAINWYRDQLLVVRNRNVLTPADYDAIGHLAHMERVATQCLQSANLKSEQRFHDMIAGRVRSAAAE